MAIVVTTPTGHIGSRVAERLLAAGADVVLLVRQPEKLPEEFRRWATVRQGNTDDPDFVVRATEGADALFWLTPPSLTAPDMRAYYKKFADAVTAALRANRLLHVVNLSSIGAQKPEGVGFITRVGEIERAIDAVAANVLHLRPGAFFENFLTQVEAIRRDGAIYLPGPGSVRHPMIATRDIGDMAAAKLLDRSWTGRSVLGLHGPADLNYDEAAVIIGAAIGKPVRHVAITPEQFRQAAAGWGASADFIDHYLEMVEGTSRPDAKAELRTPETTTPTTLAEWAGEVLAPLASG